MLNQANPASLSGLKIYLMNFCLSPATQPPPWTRMAAGNGPEPSGTCASRVREKPSGLANSMSLESAALEGTVTKSRITQQSSAGGIKCRADLGARRVSIGLDLRLDQDIGREDWAQDGINGRPVSSRS